VRAALTGDSPSTHLLAAYGVLRRHGSSEWEGELGADCGARSG
jgi:hypothetical protein